MSRGHSRRIEALKRRQAAGFRRRHAQDQPAPQPVDVDQVEELARRRREHAGLGRPAHAGGRPTPTDQHEGAR